MNAAAASVSIALFLSARLPTRTTEEQRDHQRHAAIGGIDIAERHDRDDAGDDEEAAGHDPAERPMHEPADISRELLRFGTRQQHAVVEGMQKARLGNPAFLIDQDAMHHRDLAGRTTEAEQCDAQPDAERLAQRDSVCWLGSLALNHRKLSHSLSPSCMGLRRSGQACRLRHQV
jgi:hypothetical protein